MQLPHESRCTRFAGQTPQVGIVRTGECHDVDVRRDRLDPAAHLEAVHAARKAEIEQDDVRPKPERRFQQRRAIECAADHVAGERQQPGDRGANPCIVVGDEDARSLWWRLRQCGLRARADNTKFCAPSTRRQLRPLLAAHAPRNSHRKSPVVLHPGHNDRVIPCSTWVGCDLGLPAWLAAGSCCTCPCSYRFPRRCAR